MKKNINKLVVASLIALAVSGCSGLTDSNQAGGSKIDAVQTPVTAPETSASSATGTLPKPLLSPNHSTYRPSEQIKAYYELWKNGNHFDQEGNRIDAPGYVQGFELPEVYKLPWEETGSDMGAVVVMVPNGTPDELPGEYCVSTNEAMGYGMIIAALMDDRQLFDAIFRVADYYDSYKGGWQPNLTSWAIAAQKGADWFETDEFKALTPEAQDQWRENGVRYAPKYKENTSIKESVILGEALTPRNASGSAMDGELDIAYALYLAHAKWGSDSEHHYLELAQTRFKAIITVMVEPYGQFKNENDKDTLYLPAGDYFSQYHNGKRGVERAITRPCDWMNGQLRTYAIQSGDPLAIKLIESNYTLSKQLANPETGFVPDFAMWVINDKGEDVLAPAPDTIANEWMTDQFYMNSSRYPFRQALDYQHYGDQRGLDNALAIVDFMIATYGFKTPEDFEAYPPAIHSLDGVPNDEGLWVNPVLNAGMYAAASASGDQKYQAFVNMGWDSLANNFDSRYNDYDQNGLGLDPSHSGYFSDTWRLMAMLSMSGKWPVPEAK